MTLPTSQIEQRVLRMCDRAPMKNDSWNLRCDVVGPECGGCVCVCVVCLMSHVPRLDVSFWGRMYRGTWADRAFYVPSYLAWGNWGRNPRADLSLGWCFQRETNNYVLWRRSIVLAHALGGLNDGSL